MNGRTPEQLIGLFFMTLLINPAIFLIIAGIWALLKGCDDEKEKKQAVNMILGGLVAHLVLFMCIMMFDCGGGDYDDGRYDGLLR